MKKWIFIFTICLFCFGCFSAHRFAREINCYPKHDGIMDKVGYELEGFVGFAADVFFFPITVPLAPIGFTVGYIEGLTSCSSKKQKEEKLPQEKEELVNRKLLIGAWETKSKIDVDVYIHWYLYSNGTCEWKIFAHDEQIYVEGKWELNEDFVFMEITYTNYSILKKYQSIFKGKYQIVSVSEYQLVFITNGETYTAKRIQNVE